MPRLLCAVAFLFLAAAPARADEEGRSAASGRQASYRGVGAGDALGQRMFGRALHRRRILDPAAQQSVGRKPFDPQVWLDRQTRQPTAR
ncbi:MAG: hypothetical protein JRG82_13325 [Deltaproteobacteria bacterium]|nr:hypothetical protein [Deltaproteobacteria bacterium]